VVGAALACGDGTGPEPGTFSATVSGDLSLTLSGEAVFAADTIEGNALFAIALIRGDVGTTDNDIILIGRETLARPGSGAYPIVSGFCTDCSADDFDAALAIVRADDLGAYVSESGTLTISSSSADRIVGSGTMTLTAFISFQDAQDIAIELSFEAVPGELPSPN
jgi:hypothetical protein